MSFVHGVTFLRERHSPLLRASAVLLVVVSLTASLILLTKHTHLGGPGDQLSYYTQAAQLLPFTDHFYGPGYFAGLRVVHDLLGVEWFTAARLLSWLSACVFIYLCHLLFRRLLEPPLNWLALGLVAANPTLISEAYGSTTIVFGAVWVLAGIVATVYSDNKSHRVWLLAGLFFGVAFLTRFQALGFFFGASVGVMFLNQTPFSRRISNVAGLLGGFALPVAAWYLFLLWSQGFIPQNHNFVHLTHAMGKFDWDYEDIVTTYGGALGVLRSEGAAVAIAGMTVKEALKFPFTIGFQLLFICAGWLVPGFVATASNRQSWAPWFIAFLIGLVITGLGIGALGWVWYYLPVLPFTAILISYGAQALARGGNAMLATLQAGIMLASTVLWSPVMVRASFLETDWPEWSVARDYLQARAKPTDLVSSTAGSLPYSTTLRFVDRDELIKPGEEGELVERLRAHGVTYLVLTERHGYANFPSLQYLLADVLPELPPGFVRELLITKPKRLAIYRIFY
jgi:4-amino-4-deoxy-L-arabinose transferase-like glycosyltransferase